MSPFRDQAQLNDGTRIRIRPISPEDRDALATGLERLSPESRYRRFFTPLAQLGERELDYLTRVDHRDHEALVAVEESTGEGIAVARYVRLADHADDRDLAATSGDPADAADAAEPAIVVANDWQGRGVAGHLLAALVDRARDEGIRQFVAPVLAENAESIAVFQRLGETAQERTGQEVKLTIDLTEPQRADSLLGDVLRAVASGILSPVHLLSELIWRKLPPPTGFGDTIVVGTDGSDDARFAVDCAGALAASLGCAVHVVGSRRPLDDRAPIGGQLQDAARALRARSIEVHLHQQRDDPVLSILHVAHRERASLIVLAAGASGPSPVLLSRSVWDMVAHRAQCNVLLTRRGDTAEPVGSLQ